MNVYSFDRALDGVFGWILETSMFATVLIALVFIVQICFKKVLTPRWRYALGLLVLIRLAMPAVPASSLSIFNLGRQFSPPPPAVTPAATVEPVMTVSESLIVLTTPIAIAPPKRPFDFRELAAYVWLAGFVAMIGVVAWRHRRFISELRRWGPVTDPRVPALLAECRAVIGLNRPVAVLAATGLSTPALFGMWRPRLLIPVELLKQLDDRELRHIFLHELVHLKRGDVLVNWAMIFFRALHWFNPAVWLAFRRLRADQEMACDATVMERLAAGERRSYGNTLIKLLDDFSPAGLSPGLVPFITNKQVIKRRITMISQFKPSGRAIAAASIMLLLALGCFTFTRAAETGEAIITTPDATMSPIGTSPAPQTPATPDSNPNSSAKLRDLDERILKLQEELDHMRISLRLPNASVENEMAKTQSYEAVIAESEREINREESVLLELKSLEGKVRRDVFPRVVNDDILNALLKQLLASEAILAGLRSSVSENHPDFVKAATQKDELSKQVLEQMTAILRAKEIKIQLLKRSINDSKKKIKEAWDSNRPLVELKATLERLQRERSVEERDRYSAGVSESETKARVLRSREQDELEKIFAAAGERYEPGLRRPLPPASSVDLIVNIAKDGSIRTGTNSRSISVEQLKSEMRAAHEKDPGLGIQIQVDQNASFSVVIKVMDAATEIGITRRSFFARPN